MAPSLSSSSSPPLVPFPQGCAVEARYKGRQKWFPAEVEAVNSIEEEGREGGSTYDLLYADGDREAAVPRLRIRSMGQKEPRFLDPGTACEAFFGGGHGRSSSCGRGAAAAAAAAAVRSRPPLRCQLPKKPSRGYFFCEKSNLLAVWLFSRNQLFHPWGEVPSRTP